MLITTRMVSHSTSPVVSGRQEGTIEVSATVTVPAVIFGELGFVIAIAALNTMIVILYVVELLRTRVWAGLPPIDLANLSDIIISAAKGGIVVAEEVRPASVHSRSRKTSPWTYSQAEPFTDSIRIYMRPDKNKENMLAMVPLLDKAVAFAQGDEEFTLKPVQRQRAGKMNGQYLRLQDGWYCT